VEELIRLDIYDYKRLNLLDYSIILIGNPRLALVISVRDITQAISSQLTSHKEFHSKHFTQTH